MTLLAFLPQSIIDLILDEEMSPSVIKLWISGDRLMQHKISTGVTTIKLVDCREYSSSRFPKFIEDLHVLRELTIDRAGYTMPYYRNIHQHIQQLPSTLKKLIIRVMNSKHIIQPPTPNNTSKSLSSTENHTTKDLIHPEWAFKSSFPQLETLELDSEEKWENRDLTLLPHSLTSLSIPSCTLTTAEAPSSILPPHLLTLKIRHRSSFTPSFWRSLPPHLTKLRIQSQSLESHESLSTASMLPRSLKRLDGEIPAQLDLWSLPSGIECLRTSYLESFDPNAPIGKLFPNLKEFQTVNLTPQLARSLPPSVHTIGTVESGDTFEPKDWPASLTKLCGFPAKFSLSSFPTGLTVLRLSGFQVFHLSKLALLPKSLRFLLINSRRNLEMTDVDYPPHLTFLSLSGAKFEDKCFRCHTLPRSLTELDLSTSIPASQLKHLPSRLETLNITDISIDSDFNPYDEAEIAAMRLNFENGRREGILESFDFNQLKRASVLALLPRTLIFLSVWGDAMQCDVQDWHTTPPRLQNLFLNPNAGISSKFLHHLPYLKALQSLNITLNDAQDHDLQIIPTWIQLVQIYFVDSPQLTSMALQHASARVAISIERFESEIDHLDQLRSQHADDEDPSYFLKLISPNHGVIM